MYKLRKVGIALEKNVMRKLISIFRYLEIYPQSKYQIEQTKLGMSH